MDRYLGIVLHCHIPWVLGEGVWPHGVHWLHQAVADSYLPLWEELSRLEEGAVSVSFTPVLLRQLEDAGWQADFRSYLTERRDAARRDEGDFERRGEGAQAGLARFWAGMFEERLRRFEELGGDLPGAFRALADRGRVEILTSAATHGILPLLPPGSRRAQIALGMSTSRQVFGREPAGFWLPECAYRPKLEQDLAQAGVRYTILDAGLLGGRRAEPYGGETAGSNGPTCSPYRPYRFPGGQVAFFVRDPRTAQTVWSRQWGYPGDPAYLEFHKRRDPGGHRYWRVTDHHCDLAFKEVYDPEAVAEPVRMQADHFVAQAREHLGYEPGGILVSPFDGELFGHWWFEGPRWLGEVLRRWSAVGGYRAVSLGRYLDEHPPREVCRPAAGSWGEGGDFRVWDNPDTRWVWQAIQEGDAEVARREAQAGREELAAAAQELLLLEGSDWPFCIFTGEAQDYARQRLADHRRHLGEFLARGGSRDVFREVDPGWWR